VVRFINGLRLIDILSAWYERLALVLMNHYNATPLEKEEKMREAVQVCIDGLLDEDTHLSQSSGLRRSD